MIRAQKTLTNLGSHLDSYFGSLDEFEDVPADIAESAQTPADVAELVETPADLTDPAKTPDKTLRSSTTLFDEDGVPVM